MARTTIRSEDITAGQIKSADLETNVVIDGDLTVDTDSLHVDSTNNRVGVGTNNPSYKVSVLEDGNNFVQFESTTDSLAGSLVGRPGSSADFRIQNSENANILFWTNNTERMRIDSSGNLLVGATAISATSDEGSKLLNDGRIYTVNSYSTNSQESLSMYSTGASAYRFYVGWGGTIYATSTSITAISDESLKENIRDLDKGLDTILALQPRRFDWKNGDGNDIMGFIAQEVEEVMPELVHEYKYNAEETKKGLKMGDILPSMVKAIQEQQAIIEDLQTRIAALESN